jgi:hypothetical protein
MNANTALCYLRLFAFIRGLNHQIASGRIPHNVRGPSRCVGLRISATAQVFNTVRSGGFVVRRSGGSPQTLEFERKATGHITRTGGEGVENFLAPLGCECFAIVFGPGKMARLGQAFTVALQILVE